MQTLPPDCAVRITNTVNESATRRIIKGSKVITGPPSVVLKCLGLSGLRAIYFMFGGIMLLYIRCVAADVSIIFDSE